jgi:hypothetical protein
MSKSVNRKDKIPVKRPHATSKSSTATKRAHVTSATPATGDDKDDFEPSPDPTEIRRTPPAPGNCVPKNVVKIRDDALAKLQKSQVLKASKEKASVNGVPTLIIVFNCGRCDKPIVEYSKDHDDCSCVGGDVWWCWDCFQTRRVVQASLPVQTHTVSSSPTYSCGGLADKDKDNDKNSEPPPPSPSKDDPDCGDGEGNVYDATNPSATFAMANGPPSCGDAADVIQFDLGIASQNAMTAWWDVFLNGKLGGGFLARSLFCLATSDATLPTASRWKGQTSMKQMKQALLDMRQQFLDWTEDSTIHEWVRSKLFHIICTNPKTYGKLKVTKVFLKNYSFFEKL